MARSAVLNVSVLLDAAQAAAGLNDTAGKFEKFGKKLVSAAVAAVAIKGVTDLAKTVVTAASDMQQAVGGTDKVFGTSASEIHSWAKDTSDSIRLPAVAVEKFATLIKTQLNATGQPIEQLVQSTKDLIQVGADLSAVTGADLADSIAAVKSALAGEYDPIQNLGVAMTGASVQAKALALAHGDTTAAASDAIIMQARVAEIMDKSAFATGAAAEEADSFQGRMDSLTEKAQNLAATAGGPLLDSLGNIVGSLTDVAGSATTVASGLGTMLGSVLALPGPIQAMVLGLAAFVAISATWGTKAFGAFSTFASGIKSATTSVSGFKSAVASIGPALAGGALLVGVGLIIAGIAKAIGEVTEGAQKGQDALQGYRDAIVAAGGASTDATAEAFKQAVLTSDAFAGLVTTGFSAADAVKILTGTQEDWIAIQSNGSDTTKNLTNEISKQVDGFIDANGQAKGLAQAQIDGEKAMGGHADAVDEDAKAMQDAAAQADALKKSLDDAKKAADSTTGNRMLDGIKTAADNAGRALDLFSAQMDTLTGKNESSSSALFDFTDGLRDLGEGFKDGEGHIQVNVDALAAFDAAAIAADGNTTALSRSLDDQAGFYDTMVSGAYSAALATGSAADATKAAGEAADSARYQFVQYVAGVLGGGDDAIAKAEAIADQYGILGATQIPPAIFDVIANDAAAQATVKRLQDAGNTPLMMQLEAGADGALHTVDDVISYVDAAGTKAEVAVNANPDPALKTIDGQVVDPKRSTTPIQVTVDPTDAYTMIGMVVGTRWKTSIAVTAVVNDAYTMIGMVTGTRFSATITAGANTQPAADAIRAVANGSYTATIRVVADTSSFNASFNALPTSKGVGAAPRLAPAVSMIQSFGAPSLARSAAVGFGAPVESRSVSATAGITINVHGALFPDDAARAVADVMRRRDRRAGAVAI